MSTYRGEATVVIGLVEYEVTANLSAGTEQLVIRSRVNPPVMMDGLSHWEGYVDVADDGVAWEIHEARQGQIRLPDGGIGTFIPVGGELGTTRVDITGTGPAPFPLD